MNLHPARFESESFKDYKIRRAKENKELKEYFSHPPRAKLQHRIRYGKAGTKRMKRARRLAREDRSAA